MTDAVKFSIQQEVMVSQSRLQHLQQENDRFTSELEVMKNEKSKLLQDLALFCHDSQQLSFKLESLETEKLKLLSDLELLNAKNSILHEVKAKYFSMVEERVTLMQRVHDSEGETKLISLVATNDNFIPSTVVDPTLRHNMEDKKIHELETQLKDLSSEKIWKGKIWN